MTNQAYKDPDEILDYVMDYSREFAKSEPVDQIATSVWSVSPDTLDIDSEEVIGTDKARVWVSGGGKLHTSHRLTNRVTTIGGRTYDRTIKVTIRSK
jgi:hypothetical protein